MANWLFVSHRIPHAGSRVGVIASRRQCLQRGDILIAISEVPRATALQATSAR